MGARGQYNTGRGRRNLHRVQPGLSVAEMAAFKVLAEREGLPMAAVARAIIRAHLEDLGLLEPRTHGK